MANASNIIDGNLLALSEVARVSGTRVTIEALSDATGLNGGQVRTQLLMHYGSDLLLKRGRTGGVYFRSSPKPQPAAPAPAPAAAPATPEQGVA